MRQQRFNAMSQTPLGAAQPNNQNNGLSTQLAAKPFAIIIGERLCTQPDGSLSARPSLPH